MTETNESQADLFSRIDLIESMMQEGRRTTEYWGWVFVLWGAAYLIAIGWSNSSAMPQVAWPVTMIAAVILTVLLAIRQTRGKTHKPAGRAIGCIWATLGTAIFIYTFAAAASGHYEMHSYFAAVEIFLGSANCASSLVLRWRTQFLVALLWWVSAVATCFVATRLVLPILLIDTFIGFLGFGLYLMYCERRDRRRIASDGASHA